MNVTISVSGSFPAAYQFGRYLEERGRLTRLINPLPYRRTRRFGVSRARTRSLLAFGGWHYLNNVYVPERWRSLNQYAIHVAFDRAVSMQLGRPDIVNVWAANALATIRRAHRRGMPVVLHTGSTHIQDQTSILREEFRRFGYQGPLTDPRLVSRTAREYEEADAIVVPSKIVLSTFLEKGLPPEKLHLVPWAPRPLIASPPRQERAQGGPARLLFVGNCSIRKGIPYLFDAFRRLDGAASLRLVGPTSAAVFACAGGLPAGVEAAGPLRGESLAQAYRDADVFVIASVEEGSPFVVNEAMAAGLPVVVSDRVGADQVVDGVNGFVVPARDPSALARRLRELAEDPELRSRMGAQAAKSVVTRDWRDYGRELDEHVFTPLCETFQTARRG